MNKVRTCPILVREIIKRTGFHHAQQTINIRDNIRSILNLNILLLNIKLKSEKLIEYYLPKYPQHNQENILQACSKESSHTRANKLKYLQHSQLLKGYTILCGPWNWKRVLRIGFLSPNKSLGDSKYIS